MKKLVLFDRLNSIFQEEISEKSNLISQKVNSSSFLIVGAAGTIGKAVTFEILARKPKKTPSQVLPGEIYDNFFLPNFFPPI